MQTFKAPDRIQGAQIKINRYNLKNAEAVG